jgi:hypothetical protein
VSGASVGPAFSKPPRFNHLAVSLAPDQLDDAGRAAIARFYGDVFGFEEYPELTRDRAQLVLRAHHHEQFVFIVAEDQPMRAPRMDHVGLSVATKGDFDEVARRCAAWKAEQPDEVDLIDPHFEEHAGLLRLHSLYVRYRLPVMFELQHFEYLV